MTPGCVYTWRLTFLPPSPESLHPSFLPPSPPRWRRRFPWLHYNDKCAARAIISLGQISCLISHFPRAASPSSSRIRQEGESQAGKKQLFLGPFIQPPPSVWCATGCGGSRASRSGAPIAMIIDGWVYGARTTRGRRRLGANPDCRSGARVSPVASWDSRTLSVATES